MDVLWCVLYSTAYRRLEWEKAFLPDTWSANEQWCTDETRSAAEKTVALVCVDVREQCVVRDQRAIVVARRIEPALGASEVCVALLSCPMHRRQSGMQIFAPAIHPHPLWRVPPLTPPTHVRPSGRPPAQIPELLRRMQCPPGDCPLLVTFRAGAGPELSCPPYNISTTMTAEVLTLLRPQNMPCFDTEAGLT